MNPDQLARFFAGRDVLWLQQLDFHNTKHLGLPPRRGHAWQQEISIKGLTPAQLWAVIVDDYVAEANQERFDLFFRVNSGTPGESKDEEFNTAVHCITVDIDIGKPGCPPDEQTALGILLRHLPRPTFVIRSGTGLHCYWIFHETIHLGPGEWQEWRLIHENFQRWLVVLFKEAGFHLDFLPSTANVLRVPLSRNWKRGAGELVEIIQDNLATYGFELLAASVAYAEAHPETAAKPDSSADAIDIADMGAAIEPRTEQEGEESTVKWERDIFDRIDAVRPNPFDAKKAEATRRAQNANKKIRRGLALPDGERWSGISSHTMAVANIAAVLYPDLNATDLSLLYFRSCDAMRKQGSRTFSQLDRIQHELETALNKAREDRNRTTQHNATVLTAWKKAALNAR